MDSRDVMKNRRNCDESSPVGAKFDVLSRAAASVPCAAPGRAINFDRFVLDLDRGCLLVEGSEIALRPKTFEVLRYLVGKPGRLIAKDELLDAIWPRVTVTEDSLVQCIAELRRALGDGGRNLIRTVPRRGYRFEALPVPDPSAGDTLPPTRAVAGPGTQHETAPRASRRFVALFLATLVVICGGWFAGSGLMDRAQPLSIVVLPFQPAGGDPEEAFLADAVTQDLTTDLARLPGLFVIAHATARTFATGAADPQAAGRSLAVRYALDGTVAHVGDSVRINVELVSAASGAALWADRLVAGRDQLALSRDEIIGRIATTLNFRITGLESERGLRERPTDPLAIDLTTRGWALVYAGKRPANYSAARRLFRQAVERDARAANAYAGIGWTLAIMVLDGWSAEPAADIADAEAAASAALAIERDHVVAHHVRGFLFRLEGRSAAARDSFRTVTMLNPNFAPGYAQLAVMALELGRPDEVRPFVDKAMRLSPRDPSLGPWLAFVGMAELHRGNAEEAVVWLRRAVDTGTPVARHRAYLVSALALAGRHGDARAELARFRELRPGATIEGLRASSRSVTPGFLEQQERLFDGLRIASLPD